MDKKILETKNYWSGDYVLSSVDFIATKYGLKKSTRIECSSMDDFKAKNKEFKKHKLVAIPSDKTLFGKFNAYISKLKKYALQAKKCDPSFKIIEEKKPFNEVIDSVREFSKLISYPSCCIDKYIDSTFQNENLDSNETFAKIPDRIPFVFNNALNGVANIFLSFHVPCSFSCKKTLKYNQKIFNAIKKSSPLFSKEIEKLLKRPYLILLQPQLSSYASWDMRKGFLFEGSVKKNELIYSESLFFKTSYPDYGKIKNQINFEKIKEMIQKGDKIRFNDKGFEVYRKKKKIGRFSDSNELKAYLFNFV